MSVSLWSFPNSRIKKNGTNIDFELVVSKPSPKKIFLTLINTQAVQNRVGISLGGVLFELTPSKLILFNGRDEKGQDGLISDRYEISFKKSEVTFSRLDDTLNFLKFQKVKYPITMSINGNETVMRAIKIQ